jgi:uncharacterized protein YcfJ
VDRLGQGAEDLDHAEENEDRFVVLVFGEVKSGKTAVANHMAGADFDLPPGVAPSEFFVGTRPAPRLEERPVEATREYQGFRMPGMLWVDSPGVLSQTLANQELALRLVGRADFILVASSSDAPFKASEMKVLAELIERSGNTRLDGRLLVTKVDTNEESWDERRGRIVTELRRKPEQDVEEQREWCLTQLRESGLIRRMRDPRPTAVSVYLAREALGRDWLTGRAVRTPRPNWAEQWRASGLGDLCQALAQVVRSDGAELKAAWPEKRRLALDAKLAAECNRASESLSAVRDTVIRFRERLASAGVEAAKDASAAASARVREILERHGVMEPYRFDAGKAERDLQKCLRTVVAEAVDRHARPVVMEAGREIDRAVQEFVDRVSFEMNVEVRTRTHRYRSSARGWVVGQALGGAAGAYVGTELGAAIGATFGPLGEVAGALLGGWLGSMLGSEVGSNIGESGWVEEFHVQIETGTNGDEVIVETSRKMADTARRAVAAAVQQLDGAIYEPLIEELDRVLARVRGWRSALTAR